MNKILLTLLAISGCALQLTSQVSEFPYSCGFETGPDGTDIADTEPNWDGSTQWDYDDYLPKTGNYCAASSITTTSDNSRNLYVEFSFDGKTGMKPSFYYKSTNVNIVIQVVGMIDGINWIILKDWFTPTNNTWTLVDFNDLSNLNSFDNESSCRFGIRAKKNGGAATLRLDNFQIIDNNSNIWKTEASTSEWNEATNWFSNVIPSGTTNLLVPVYGGNYPVIGTADANCNNLIIEPNAQLTINSGYTLNVNGDFTVQSTATGTGSFLNNGILTMVSKGSITFERYIEAYTNDDDGWHLVSSPVDNFSVSGSGFEPGANDDLYRWDESTNMWLNYKSDAFDFSNGQGYLVAYESSATKKFSGTFNNSDIAFSDLSVGLGGGWHILGNPYPCAIEWNDGNWAITDIEGTAKVYNESAGNYTDIAPSGIIPATQGFFVNAVDATNSITIPAGSMTHDNTAFYDDVFPGITLKVSGGENSFFDITRVVFNPEATTGYDFQFDAEKLFGQNSAPQLYSISEYDLNFSTNTLPSYCNVMVDLGFEAGTNGFHQISQVEVQNFDQNTAIYLEDIFLDTLINIRNDSCYSFHASTDDPKERFRLHFWDVTGFDEYSSGTRAYSFYENGNIYIFGLDDQVKGRSVNLFDLRGRLIYSSHISSPALVVRKYLNPGIYLISIGNNSSHTIKLPVH